MLVKRCVINPKRFQTISIPKYFFSLTIINTNFIHSTLVIALHRLSARAPAIQTAKSSRQIFRMAFHDTCACLLLLYSDIFLVDVYVINVFVLLRLFHP